MIKQRTENILYIAMLLVLSFALAGCNTDESDNVTYVVITGEPPAQPTAIPPTPIPEIPPEIALQIADRYLLNGYYEDAAFSYQAIINRSDAPPEIKAAAAFGMGKASLREGLFQNAVIATTTLINDFPGDYRATQAYFLRGDAYLGLSQWQNAISDFQQYLVLRPGLIDSYLHERIGDAQLELGQYDLAFASYSLAANAERPLAPQLALREKVARLHTLNVQIGAAIGQYDAILVVAQNRVYRAEIEFIAADALINAGDLTNGLARMLRIFEQYEDRPEAYQAMNILLANGYQLDNYAQGRVRYLYGDYSGAVSAFNLATTQMPLTAIPVELHLWLGRAYRAIGNSDAAQIAFQIIIDQYPSDPLFGEALLEQGRTYFLNGDLDTAIARYLHVANTYSYLDETASRAFWRAGYLYGTQGNFEQSWDVFLQLADTYPNSEDARDGLFIAALAAYNIGNYTEAEALYRRLTTITSGDDQAVAYLQIGTLSLLRGDQTAANDAFAHVIAASPDSYYGARAQDIIAGRIPFVSPANLVFEFDDMAEITLAENWLRTTFGVVQEGALWPLSPQLESDPRIIRGRELWAVGSIEEAEEEFFGIIEDYEQDGLASYQLAVFLRGIGAYYTSIFGAANVIKSAHVSMAQAPPYIARMRYPAYYLDVVLNIAEKYNFDPLLLFALIRHESLFNTHATAAAGEKGLTQVIPSTGDYIAEQLNLVDYQHHDLFRPYAGVEFGAYYLSEQLQRFDNNVYVALSGYNAGPGRALTWLQLAGGDPDAFMSVITIDSVQLYIQRIYSYYNVYRMLYGYD